MNPTDEISQVPVNGKTSNMNARSLAPQPKVRSKKVPEIPSMERRNWLIHIHYVRKEFKICKEVIASQLEETRGLCEYANYIQGLIYRHEGMINESLEMFQICNILNPNNHENFKQMGKSLYLLGRHNQAIEAYNQAEQKSSFSDWEIHHNLGLCYMHTKKFDEAKHELERAININKNEESYLILAKVVLNHLKDKKGAIRKLKEGIEIFPENSELCTKLGLVYISSGQFQMSFEQLGTAIAFNPKNSSALTAAGSIMQANSEWDVAINKYKAACAEAPDSPQIWNNIGMCFFGKKKHVASISCLKRAVYLSPFNWKIHYNLGLVHLTCQQFASAFHFLSASINLKHSKGQTFLLLAITLSYLKDPENARSAYEQAMNLEIHDPAVPLNYAVFLFNIGDLEGSILKLKMMEERVLKLKTKSGLETDKDVLTTSRNLAKKLGYSTEASVLSDEVKKSKAPCRSVVENEIVSG